MDCSLAGDLTSWITVNVPSTWGNCIFFSTTKSTASLASVLTLSLFCSQDSEANFGTSAWFDPTLVSLGTWDRNGFLSFLHHQLLSLGSLSSWKWSSVSSLKNSLKTSLKVPDGFPGDLYQILKEGIISILCTLFQKIGGRGTLPNSF